MSLEEWIGSIISLLGLAALFFFNQRQDNPKKENSRRPVLEDEEEEDPWKEFLRMVEGEPKTSKKKPPEPPLKKSAQAKPKQPLKPHKPAATLYVYEETHEEAYKPVLHSSRITRLKSVPLFHGEIAERQSRVKKIVKNLPDLKTLIICREIIEKPKF